MLVPPDKLRYIGYYRNRRVKFFCDESQKKPWTFEFEDSVAASADVRPEPDLASAKAAALQLARTRYGGPSEENWDEWVDLSKGDM
jgi:hypothetical protein